MYIAILYNCIYFLYFNKDILNPHKIKSRFSGIVKIMGVRGWNVGNFIVGTNSHEVVIKFVGNFWFTST